MNDLENLFSMKPEKSLFDDVDPFPVEDGNFSWTDDEAKPKASYGSSTDDLDINLDEECHTPRKRVKTDSGEDSIMLGKRPKTKGETTYLGEEIHDPMTGQVYRFEDDPVEYGKARKRQQNGESAIGSGQRKRDKVVKIEDKVQNLVTENQALKTENATLKAEKKLLQDQLTYFQSVVENMSRKSSESDMSLPLKSPKLVLNGKESNGSAGMFFLAIVMCLLCFGAVTLPGKSN